MADQAVAPQLIRTRSITALNAFVNELESLAETIAGADDDEHALIELEPRLESTIHQLDCELRRRGAVALST